MKDDWRLITWLGVSGIGIVIFSAQLPLLAFIAFILSFVIYTTTTYFIGYLVGNEE